MEEGQVYNTVCVDMILRVDDHQTEQDSHKTFPVTMVRCVVPVQTVSLFEQRNPGGGGGGGGDVGGPLKGSFCPRIQYFNGPLE